MHFKTGVLIIGSLWWDGTKQRPQWRHDRLELGGRVRVYAPIYYGRRSKDRGHYTMTFDVREPTRWAGGRALLVPTKRAVICFEDLWEEARALWDAERDGLSASGGPTATVVGEPTKKGRKSWGTIGLFCSDAEMRTRWRAAVEDGRVVMPDKPWFPVDRNSGLARFGWPTVIGEKSLADFDAILVAATLPDEIVPPAEEVAAMFKTAGADYLLNNRRAGISTTEDQQILDVLGE